MTGSRVVAGRDWARDLRGALAYPLTSDARLLSAAVGTVLTYVVLVLSSFPQFSIQVLANDPTDVGYAVTALTREVALSTGRLGLVLVAAYAVLTGVAVTNAIALVRRAWRRGASTIVGVLPGVFAAGCASCGAGVLGALGFVGAMAALPFDGNLLRVGGIALLLLFLGRAGDPRTCTIDGGAT
ncbi:hypothetical protein G9C85_14745 [Halorubellus sp. JP-L1]|uniref:hypothetical protein n=1 Tax=Halorubellus sp. JP-L1 TaxID=2715753 RepID=UPI00140A62FD|nr:hypothetical protein [Halorubellus sp. JP-L1]NHN42876.1 hypothetical protein [Halorubellus sp. JP-L1]